jgi:hypothetical protein
MKEYRYKMLTEYTCELCQTTYPLARPTANDCFIALCQGCIRKCKEEGKSLFEELKKAREAKRNDHPQ